jgi:hypothetical protein
MFRQCGSASLPQFFSSLIDSLFHSLLSHTFRQRGSANLPQFFSSLIDSFVFGLF